MSPHEKERYQRKSKQVTKHLADHSYKFLQYDEIADVMWEYAAADVKHFEALCNLFMPRMTAEMRNLVRQETDLRLEKGRVFPVARGTNIALESFSSLPRLEAIDGGNLDYWALWPDQRLVARTCRHFRREKTLEVVPEDYSYVSSTTRAFMAFLSWAPRWN